MEQGTDDWFAARCGKVTASRIADVMAKTKTGYGAGRKNYLAQLVIERLTGDIAEGYTNAAMLWGIETEKYAREAYEIETGEIVEQVGFIDHPAIPMTGASPDGLVGIDGMLEIKCPNSATHIETLLSGKVAKQYILQMHWQMMCAGRAWCDFVSYDPRMPEGLQYWSQRVTLDESLAADITSEVNVFLDDLDAQAAELDKLRAA